MITIKNLKKNYGNKVAVDMPNYTAMNGEIIGLVGNNGAGKTTLFRLILDLLKADSGTIEIDGTDVSRSEQWKETTGAYLDESFLIDYLTPEEYFLFVGKMCGLNKETVAERITAFLHFIDEETLQGKKLIRNLSAGNKQKIGIIAALLNHPALLILDEPFNYLDPSSQSVLKHLLSEYNRKTRATILLSSHNLNHTIEISTRILLMEQGRIIRNITDSVSTAGEELKTYFEKQIRE